MLNPRLQSGVVTVFWYKQLLDVVIFLAISIHSAVIALINFSSASNTATFCIHTV